MAEPARASTAEPRVWFTSDTHFGHAGVLGIFKRPFGSVAEMDAAMIGNWNSMVGPDDIVWHLGDFGYRLKQGRAAELLSMLNGRKRLIVGNNDDAPVLAAPGWESVSHYNEIDVAGARVVLCHYAFRSWNGMNKRAWNLHGHSHGALAPLLRQADVGVDVWNFTPVTFTEIAAARTRSRGVSVADSGTTAPAEG